MNREETKRNYGIDLLRIVSMLMICMLHILGRGGVWEWTPYGREYKIAELLWTMCYGAVDCYALISGYVTVTGKPKLRSILRMWLQVVFYSAGITFLFACFQIGGTRMSSLAGAFLPVLREQYWYFTAYFFLFFLMPFLNQMLNALDQKALFRLMGLLVLMFSVLQVFTGEIFHTAGGHSFAWLAILYLLGGCMRRLNLAQRVPLWGSALVYLLTVLAAWKCGGELTSDISPAMVIGSMAMVLFFARLPLKGPLCRIISWIAPLTFGVYLIHVHPLVFDLVLKNAFRALGGLKLISYAAALAGGVLGLFAVCALIEWIRQQLFRWLRIDAACAGCEKLLGSLEDKLFGCLLVKN